MTEPRPLPYAWDDVKSRLQKNLPGVLAALGLRYRERDSEPTVKPLNPTRNDKHPGSFVIWTQGSAAGAWREFAGIQAKGDVFGLIGYVLGLQEKIDAYWWALDHLGLERGRVRTKAQDVRERERRERDAAAAAVKDQQAAEAKQRQLFGLWLGLPPIAGTPAEHYLRDVRRVPLERLKHQPGAVRWARAVEWVDPETGEVREWNNVMVSAMTAGTRVVALHRTWLTADGSGPDPVRKARGRHKTMIGSASGAAIRLSPGPSGLSPTMAAKKGVTGPLALGEGIETCLPVAVARADYRVWAAGSLSLMGLLDWPDCASAVVLLRDNDWDKPEAIAAFGRVEAHWQRQARGRPVVVVAPPPGVDDFSSWAMQGMAA
jgi:hypothetical protein